MAEVKVKFTAEDKLSATLERISSTGQNVTDRLGRAFAELGIKTTASYDQQRAAVNRAYDQIRNSGVATADELTRAERARAAAIEKIDSQHFGKRTTLLQKFKANWLGITASMTAAYMAATRAWNSAMQAAEGMQQAQSFANLAASHGLASDKIIADLKRVSAQTIATKDLIEKAGTAMLLGIQGQDLSKLMEIARASSRITGQSVTKSFEDISLAVARGSRMILDNLGIIVKVEEANETYATALGKTSAQLTEAEKKQAFLNATLAAGQEIIDRVGTAQVTAVERMQQVQAGVKNLQETLGRGLLSSVTAVYGGFNLLAAGSLKVYEGLMRVAYAGAWLVRNHEAMAELGFEIDVASAAAADLAEKGFDALASSADILTGKIAEANDAVAKAKAEAAAAAEEQKRLAAEQEAYAKSLEDASALVQKYSSQIADLGKNQLKIAESDFTSALSRQADLLKKNGAAASDLAAPLRTYLSLIGQAYGTQINAQKELAKVLGDLGATQADQLKQQSAILATEQAYAQTRLAAWRTYYDKLQGMHDSTLEEMSKKQEELLALQEFGAGVSKALEEKFNPAAALDPYEQFFRDLDRIDDAATEAMEKTGDKKVDALKKVMESLKALPTEVREGDQVIISSLDAYEQITARLTAYREAAEGAKQAEIDRASSAATALADEMARAETTIEGLETTVGDLANRIAQLDRTILLDVDDQASAPIGKIEAALQRLKNLAITVTAQGSESSGSQSSGSRSSGSSGSMGSDPNAEWGSYSPGYAVGTRYIPRTGTYKLHQGEQVLNRNEVSARTSGGITIAGGINITLPGVKEASAQSARALARALYPELQRLAVRS